MSKEELFEKMKRAIIEGNKEEAILLAQEALEKKIDLNGVIEKGYVPGIQKVGDLWEKGEYFLPELVTSAECMKAAMIILQPELEKAQIQTQSKGKVIIGTVEGDIHDIGKNLVSSMLSANGFDVLDLGEEEPLAHGVSEHQQLVAGLHPTVLSRVGRHHHLAAFADGDGTVEELSETDLLHLILAWNA